MPDFPINFDIETNLVLFSILMFFSIGLLGLAKDGVRLGKINSRKGAYFEIAGGVLLGFTFMLAMSIIGWFSVLIFLAVSLRFGISGFRKLN